MWRYLKLIPGCEFEIRRRVNQLYCTEGSHFTTGLRSRIFGCKSDRLKTSAILIVSIYIVSWAK
jgi:hypothetical protein